MFMVRIRKMAKVNAAALSILFAVVGISLLIPPQAARAQLVSLKTIPTPEPLDLANYVVNRTAAIALGKALFWDLQVGSDGATACASCHFQAGADNRTRNQINPGTPLAGDTLYNNNNLGLPAPPAGSFGPNVDMTRAHFPFHNLTDPDLSGEPASNPGNVISDCNDVMSSMGVELRQFVDIRQGNPVDLGTPIPDPPFQLAGVNIRRVEPRNTPSMINAVFNFANFWDGRANNIFNGNNPFGPADPRNHLIVNVVATGLETRPVRLRQSSLASQAVGPPLSDFEMSWRGRTWPKIGKKMLSLKPLGQQRVHPSDSVLGPLADNVAGVGLTTNYNAMIRAAFPARFWNNTAQIVTFTDGVPSFSARPARALTTSEYTQIQANFSFFFGIAVQLYEASLLANDSKLDRFLEGNAALTFQESQGMNTFLGAGGCGACHQGAVTSDADVFFIQGADPITGFPQPLNRNPLDAMEFMSFLSSRALYDAPFHNNSVRPGGSTNPTDPQFLATNEDDGRGGNTPFFADPPTNSFPIPLSFGKLAMWKAGRIPGAPPVPATLTNFIPPFPFGFRPDSTIPQPNRTNDFGAHKTPGLRNVELTGPYFHNGGMSTLHQVVEFYTRGGDFPLTNIQDFDPAIFPIGKMIGSDQRKNELVAFLLTMTDQRVKDETAPFDHPELFIPIDGRAPVSPGSRAGFLANPTMFRQLPAVGAGGRPAELLPSLAPFLNVNHFLPE